MRWSCLHFNVLLLPESYRRLPAETRWKPLLPPPTRPGRNLENNTQSRPYSTHTAPMRFSGSSLIFSCLTVSFSCGIVYSREKKRPRVKKRKRTYISSNGKSKRKCWYTYQVLIYTCVLALEGVNSSPSSRERLFLRTTYIPFSSSTFQTVHSTAPGLQLATSICRPATTLRAHV